MMATSLKFRSLFLSSFAVFSNAFSEEPPPLPPPVPLVGLFPAAQSFIEEMLSQQGCLTEVQARGIWVDGRLKYNRPFTTWVNMSGTGRNEEGLRIFSRLASSSGVTVDTDLPAETPAPHCLEITSLKFNFTSLANLIRSQKNRTISDVYMELTLKASPEGAIWILEYTRFVLLTDYGERATVNDESGAISFQKIPDPWNILSND